MLKIEYQLANWRVAEYTERRPFGPKGHLWEPAPSQPISTNHTPSTLQIIVDCHASSTFKSCRLSRAKRRISTPKHCFLTVPYLNHCPTGDNLVNLLDTKPTSLAHLQKSSFNSLVKRSLFRNVHTAPKKITERRPNPFVHSPVP